ncbi:Nesprin-2 [Bagarius yarrelli]|uniref:Nesprin-2 n=1 Tax=Bagarius yarrelli TaxID=175774 RepID=A0A556V565_BAGYA|nr:Nesprin-2 [Bagarius yarrelli]
MLNELSYSLTLSDHVTQRLQSLNRKWARESAHAQERCSELQAVSLERQVFEERCETWMSFLQKMEDSLAGEIASTYPGLREQLRTHQRFQAELSLGHQILHSVIAEALRVLQRGEVEDRSDFLLKLAQLREQWQGAVQRAAQRRTLVEGLIRHWHRYTHTLRKLNRLLSLAHTLLPPAGLTHCSVSQLRHSLKQLERTELLFQRSLSSYLLLLDVGRQLFSVSDEETQTLLQTDLATLQEDFERSQCMLGKWKTLTADVIKTWESCTTRLDGLAQRLEELKARLEKHPIQEMEKETITELQDSLEDWAASLSETSSMKTDLSQYIITEDVLMLQEQEEHLHCQWEELCFKVSMRKQEIAEQLNAWIIFSDKNRELCEWLTHMENKMTHSSEISIQEMVEKLKKDCMEEINLFSEHKTHLKHLGEQLITAGTKNKESEIKDKIEGINERWQHLFNHIEARVRKLKETLVMVQQLDKNMSNLRLWLSHIEGELTKPIVFTACHGDEIQCKLAEQQELQKDIEQHTEGVASVLTLCDMLLHDTDACNSNVENDSIQQTTRSLDRRWRNICALSMERRMRIEETWRLWRKFLDDYSRFEDWLSSAERTAANPASTDVLYTCAKEELKKFEAFQRQVHERLTQLELVNKQYRRLARENRTDAACKLKTMVNEGNRRWDQLHRRVSAIIRRLKHFTSQREEFEGTRDAVLVWLTEMDLQLTNVEHFSESDVHDKMRQLKIDSLIVFGEKLIQKSSALDAVLIEDELEELHSYCQEVFSRVARFHHRLIHTIPVVDDEQDFLDRDASMDTEELIGVWKREPTEEDVITPVSGHPSGRETPVSVESLALEWDHTVDVGGSSSPEDEDEVTYYSALSVTESSWQNRKRINSLTHTDASYRPEGYAKLMSECTDSIDDVTRVKHILIDDMPLNHQGLTVPSPADQQTGVIERWEILQANSNDDNELSVQQDQCKLTSDLRELTSCLDSVLPELERLQRGKESPSVQDMENSICKLKESQRKFSGYKALLINVNLSGRRLLRGESAELQELKAELRATNKKWTQACAALDAWENQLHLELLQCQEFHKTLHSLLLWLARAESQRYMVNIHDPNVDVDVLQEHRDTLKAVQFELLAQEQKVQSLQQISSHILRVEQGEESMEAKEKVHVVNNKLRLLLRQIGHDLNTLQSRLKNEGSSVDSEPVQRSALTDRSRAVEEKPSPKAKEVSRGRPFLYRVLRAAFPLHLLFLLLLVFACLVPASEEDYSCALSNNFARSFYPMLRYTNGPPPT